MNTPQRDPLNAMFDRYADATAAETTRLTSGQLRSRMHRHRTVRVAAAGVAAAVLAVPGGWMLQQANATDGPTGAADQGQGQESPPCVEDGRYALLAEDTTVEDYLAAEGMNGAIILSRYEDIEEFAANPELYRVADLAEGVEGAEEAAVRPIEVYINEDGEVEEVPVGENVIAVEFYGAFEQGGAVQVLYPCDEAAPTGSPSESGTPGEEPTSGYETPTGGEEPTEAGEEPSGGEEPTEAGEEPTEAGEEPTSGYETPTAGEEPTAGDDPSEHSTP
ncbi:MULTISPECIES: hypothetical protein [Glycomyces]|uniref:Uncharacterized protein n=2 Tax=Glycomyces TaxID=58113 RepID=A0A9X3PTV9_9ACTN|nr:hypothetical protein [Glycomyces lechevalierae]MDA1385418.1 hypothetical protein [Glycomyces lechevalierae]MDR7339746.1 hypothetical protein [Glycomyces lechevalierae]